VPFVNQEIENPAGDAPPPTKTAHPPLEVGTLLAERFRIEKFAGSGGMGEVYKALDTLLERFVALKSVRAREGQTPEILERFRQEALALAQLNHSGICQVYDLVTTERGPFLAMEWVEGRTLDQAEPDLDSKSKLHILLQVAEGLEVAHAKAMIHRDLKPLNLMVDKQGRVKILDFGLARFANVEGGSSVSQADPHFRSPCVISALPVNDAELPTGHYAADTEKVDWPSGPFTRTGFFMGSPRYASPEQIRGESVGTPSDIFAFGVLMWELLLGEHPFPGIGKGQLQAVLENQRKPLRGRLSHHLAKLLEGMLAPQPRDRPTAGEIVRVLRMRTGLHPAIRWGLGGTVLLLVFATMLMGGRFGHRPLKASDLAAQHGIPLWTFESGTTEGWHGTGKWSESCSASIDHATEGRYALKLECTGSVDWNQDIAINDGPFPQDIHQLTQVSVDVTAPEASVTGMEYEELYLVFMSKTNKWYEIKRQFTQGKQTITFDIDTAQIKQDVWHVYFVLNSTQPFKGPIYLDRIVGKLKTSSRAAGS